MGYETSFKLTINDYGATAPQCLHAFPPQAKYCPDCGAKVCRIPLINLVWNEIAQHEEMVLAIGDGALKTGEKCKWYGFENDMRVLSAQFPAVLFTLEGEGSDKSDIWKAYFLRGKMQMCEAKITFDEFDVQKLM